MTPKLLNNLQWSISLISLNCKRSFIDDIIFQAKLTQLPSTLVDLVLKKKENILSVSTELYKYGILEEQ